MSKNLWAKTVTQDKAYAVIKDESIGWTWYVLKAYQRRALEKLNKQARVFCIVTSPMTYGHGDMGDTYISDIPMTREFKAILDAREKAEEET